MNKMGITLKQNQVDDLTSFIDQRLLESPCDHSLRNATEWARTNNFDYDDFIDILEYHGGYCDCEVVLNLPEDCDVVFSMKQDEADKNNPWKVPVNFELPDSNKTYTQLLISNHSETAKCYAQERELLVPAPKGAKPKKRVRKSVHFFIGIETALPNEFGFVKSLEAVTAKELAKKVRDSGHKDLSLFREKEAAFFLSRLDRLKPGNGVGTHFAEITGITSKREELKVHKIIFQK